MDIGLVGPESSALAMDFGRGWIEGQGAHSLLSQLDRGEQVGLLASLIASVETGEQFVLAAMDQGLVVGLLGVEHRAWDSDFFGVPVTHIALFVGASPPPERGSVARELLDRFLCSVHPGKRYVVAQADLEDVVCVRALESRGFGFLLPVAILGRSRLADAPHCDTTTRSHVGFGPWAPSEVEELAGLARTAFVHSRFHVEPGISFAAANELHARWVRNCCVGGLADEVLVARCEGGMTGFIALKVNEVQGSRLGDIVLLATQPEFRGLGVGTGLVRFAVDWFQERADYLTVTTEMTNLSAIRTYQRVGYRLEQEKAYLSRWLG